ncbi:MAG TPA: threonine/serine dehydratase [Micropepsaceae bacterium]|nr:threonine/serine dehydratase [Micropepsaceae bacterium]
MRYTRIMTDSPSSPTYADVIAATERIRGVAVSTPLVDSPVLSERVGGKVFLKLETLQRTGSFKFRGAYNRLKQLSSAQRTKGVVAFSSGNHAQGIAAAAKLLGMPATIVMPFDAPKVKIENTRAFGAEIVFYDRRRDKREEIAARLSADKGGVLVPAFDDRDVVSGQGTAGLEIANQASAEGVALDRVLVPCSGGGLASGIALALSEASPKTRVVTVEPQGYDGARLSLERGERSSAPAVGDSIADSLMSPFPGVIPFELLSAFNASGVAVDNDALFGAVGFAARRLKLIVEPGGAAALAAVRSGAYDARGQTIAVVLSGGNIDPEMLERCLERTLG